MNRRDFLGRSGVAAAALAGATVSASATGLERLRAASMRGSIDAAELGVRPGALDDQSRAFQAMLDKASDGDLSLFLPPGIYVVSNLALPKRVRLTGVPGATRIVYGGDGHLFAGENADRGGNVGALLRRRHVESELRVHSRFLRVWRMHLALRTCCYFWSGW